MHCIIHSTIPKDLVKEAMSRGIVGSELHARIATWQENTQDGMDKFPTIEELENVFKASNASYKSRSTFKRQYTDNYLADAYNGIFNEEELKHLKGALNNLIGTGLSNRMDIVAKVMTKAASQAINDPNILEVYKDALFAIGHINDLGVIDLTLQMNAYWDYLNALRDKEAIPEYISAKDRKLFEKLNVLTTALGTIANTRHYLYNNSGKFDATKMNLDTYLSSNPYSTFKNRGSMYGKTINKLYSVFNARELKENIDSLASIYFDTVKGVKETTEAYRDLSISDVIKEIMPSRIFDTVKKSLVLTMDRYLLGTPGKQGMINKKKIADWAKVPYAVKDPITGALVENPDLAKLIQALPIFQVNGKFNVELFHDKLIKEFIDTKEPRNQYEKDMVYYIKNLKKMLDNFKEISYVGSDRIGYLTNTKFNANEPTVTNRNTAETDNEVDFDNQAQDPQTSELEHWMTQTSQISVMSTLGEDVKVFLSQLNEKDSKGNTLYNNIGLPKKMSLNTVQGIILKGLQDVTHSDLLYPELEKLAKEYSMVHEIIKELKKSPTTEAQFYASLTKHFTNYTGTRITEENGVIKYNTYDINNSADANEFLKQWKALIAAYVVPNELAVFNDKGVVSADKAYAILEKFREFAKDFQKNRDTADSRMAWLKNNVNLMNQAINAMGIPLTDKQLFDILSEDLYKDKVITGANGIPKETVYKINTMIGGTFVKFSNSVRKEAVDREKLMKANPTTEAYTMEEVFANNSSNYRLIAQSINDNVKVGEDSVHEGDKNYYSYIQSSFLNKFLAELKTKGNKISMEQWLNENFGEFASMFKHGDEWNISWLNDLLDNPSLVNTLKMTQEIKVGRNEISDLSDRDYTALLLAHYFKDKNIASYPMPITGDVVPNRFITFTKDPTDYLLNTPLRLMGVFHQERQRMKIVAQRKATMAEEDKLIAEGKMTEAQRTILPIDNFDKNGDKFQFLFFLNDRMKDIEALEQKIADAKQKVEEGTALIEDVVAMQTKYDTWIKERIKEGLDAIVEGNIEEWKNMGLLDEDPKTHKFKQLDSLGITKDNYREMAEEYVYNSLLATINIIQLTSSDLSYYKNVEDFQKRNKEKIAPGQRLYTNARYIDRQGKTLKLGRKTGQYVILNDVFAATKQDTYEAMAKALEANHTMPDAEKKVLLDTFYNPNIIDKKTGKPKNAHNLTDAQAYMGLNTARSILSMHKGWTHALQDSYDRLQAGQFNLGDYVQIMNALKPFYYSLDAISSGNDKLRTPVQHKNSYALLIPAMEKAFNANGKSGLAGLAKLLNDDKGGTDANGSTRSTLDIAQFESAVKVGGQGKIDISELPTSKAVSDHINQFKGNDQYFHTIDYENLLIQMNVPVTFEEHENLLGTQDRALIESDITSSEVEFTMLNGTKLKRNDLLTKYNQAISENVIRSATKLMEELGDVEKFQDLLEREILKSNRYSRDLINAIQFVDGKPTIPMMEHSQSIRVQQLLNSIITSRVSKQKIKGGKLVQMSSFGFSNDLELKMNPDGSIAYMEVMMPFPSGKGSELLDKLATKDIKNAKGEVIIKKNEPLYQNEDGTYNIERLLEAGIIDEGFLSMVGYRIPTENKSSMFNMRIKGFLPKSSGGLLVMPREVTTIAGVDFDVDQVYMMQRENTFDSEKGFKTVQYDLSNKDMSTWSKEQLDNYIIDTHTAILTNLDTTAKQLMPSDFSTLKKNGYALAIYSSQRTDYSYKQLMSMDLGKLKEIYAETNFMSMINPATQVKLFQQNNIAAIMIGIFANHNKSAAIRQKLRIWNDTHPDREPLDIKVLYDISVAGIYNKDKDGNIILDGSLLRLTDREGHYISQNYKEFIAASVDAVKDPILNLLNLNTFTGDTAALLIGMGYTIQDVSQMLVAPVVKRVTNKYFRGDANTFKKVTVVENEMKNIQKQVIKMFFPDKNPTLITEEGKEVTQTDTEVWAIIEAQNTERRKDLDWKQTHTIGWNARLLDKIGGKNPPTNKEDRIDDLIDDYWTLFNLRKAMQAGSELADSNRSISVDSKGVGPDIASNLTQEEAVNQVFLNEAVEKPNIVGLTHITGFQGTKEVEAVQLLIDLKSSLLNNQNAQSLQDLKDKVEDSKLFDEDGLKDLNRIIDLAAYKSNHKLIKSELDTLITGVRGFITAQMNESPAGYIQTMNSVSMGLSHALFSKYYPHYTTRIEEALDNLKDYYKSGKLSTKTKNKIINNYISYWLSQNETFSPDKRSYYIKEFPYKFAEFKILDKELTEAIAPTLMKGLKPTAPTDDFPFTKIKFIQEGEMNTTETEVMQQEWTSMINNPKYREFAKELFIYNYFTNGLNFGNQTYNNLASVAVKLEIPGYTDLLNDLTKDRVKRNIGESNIDEKQRNMIATEHFIDQYIRNNLSDYSLVSQADLENDVWLDEDNNPVDSFTTSDDYLGKVISLNQGAAYYIRSNKSSALGNTYYRIMPLDGTMQYNYSAEIESFITEEDWANKTGIDYKTIKAFNGEYDRDPNLPEGDNSTYKSQANAARLLTELAANDIEPNPEKAVPTGTPVEQMVLKGTGTIEDPRMDNEEANALNDAAEKVAKNAPYIKDSNPKVTELIEGTETNNYKDGYAYLLETITDNGGVTQPFSRADSPTLLDLLNSPNVNAIRDKSDKATLVILGVRTSDKNWHGTIKRDFTKITKEDAESKYSNLINSIISSIQDTIKNGRSSFNLPISLLEKFRKESQESRDAVFVASGTMKIEFEGVAQELVDAEKLKALKRQGERNKLACL